MPTDSPDLPGVGGAGEGGAPISDREQALNELKSLSACLVARIKALEMGQRAISKDTERIYDPSAPPELVTIVVGADTLKKTFHFDRALITGASPFFKTAFEGESSNERVDTLRFSDVDEKTFGSMSNWIHTSNISLGSSKVDLKALRELWLLGDRFALLNLQNDVIDTAWKRLNDPDSEIEGLVEVTESLDWISSDGFGEMLQFYWEFSIEAKEFIFAFWRCSENTKFLIACALKANSSRAWETFQLKQLQNY